MSYPVILLNQASCLLCNDVITSHTRHDYVTCKCGEISVDGGNSYLKRSWRNDMRNIVEESVTIPSFDDLSIDTTSKLWYDFLRYFDTNSKIQPDDATTIDDYTEHWEKPYSLGNPYILALNFIVRNRTRISELIYRMESLER